MCFVAGASWQHALRQNYCDPPDNGSTVTIKELAINVIGPLCPIQKSIVSHNNQHTFVNPQIGRGSHEFKVEIDGESKCPLPGFFFKIRQRSRLCSWPLDWAVFSHSMDAYKKMITVLVDHDLCDALCPGVGI